MIFHEKLLHFLIPTFDLWMRDAFGNYLCQKIISTSTLDQINMIL